MRRLRSKIVLISVLPLFSSPASAQKSRDLSKLRPCEIVLGTDVSGIAKGKLLSSPTNSPTACIYLIELPNGKVENYQLFLHTAELMATMLGVMAPAEKGELMPGLLDEAYLGKQQMGNGLRLLALRRGDMAIEVTGERKDVVIAVARHAVSRLK